MRLPLEVHRIRRTNVLVINIRDAPKDWSTNPAYVYIGRSNKYGNPIKADRACPVCDARHNFPSETLACYEVWLLRKLRKEPNFLKPLVGKILVCFCKPKPCHGNVIIKYL